MIHPRHLRLPLLLAALALFASGVAAKNLPPDPATLSDADKLVTDTFKLERDAAKTPEQKAALAKKLLATAHDEKDPGAHYVLLVKARDLAADAADLPDAFAAIDAIAETYAIDPLKLKRDIATAAASKIHAPDARQNLARQLAPLIAAAVSEDRYDLAATSADLALASARASGDPDLTQQAAADLQRVHELQAAYSQIQNALRFAAKPNDADANLRLGKFQCFLKADWEKGLPLLAASADPVLKPLALQELSSPADAAEQAKLADAWWDAAEKLLATEKAAAQTHAILWYRQALPTLDKGLLKAKIEQRVAQFDAAIAAANAANAKWINLLKLINPARDTAQVVVKYGAWKFDNASLVSNEFNAWLEIPYIPPEEYDVRYSFTRISGAKDVSIYLTQGKKQFAVTWNQNGLGIDQVNHLRPGQNGGKYVPTQLTNGQRHTIQVEIRKASIRIILDEKPVVTVETEGQNLDVYVRPKDPQDLCLNTVNSPASFHAIEIREVTGHGKVALPPEK